MRTSSPSGEPHQKDGMRAVDPAPQETAALRGRPELVSIVVPAYNESANVGILAADIASVMQSRPWELILVDDGSSDDTFSRIADLARGDPRIRGLSLTRNFGHQYALAAGLSQARGQVVITMDADLQHPPALLPAMIEKWREGYKVVQGLREEENIPLFKRLTSRWFYKIFSLLCGIRLEPGMSDFRLIDREVIDHVNAVDEGNLFLRGLLAWMGYRQARLPYRPGRRHSGASKYGLRRMFGLAWTAIFAFSPVPLRIGTTVGLLMSALSIAELGYVLYAYMSGRTIPGWASTMAFVCILFAILLLLVGMQGAYLLKIYERIQRRPRYIVERTCGQTDDPARRDRPE
jgi:glycosyltransferase involved in cell wall biosynthesis